MWLHHSKDNCCHWTQSLQVRCLSNSQEVGSNGHWLTLWTSAVNQQDAEWHSKGPYRCVSRKNAWNEDQATGCQGNFLDLVLKEPKRNPPDKQQDDAAGNKGEEDFEILWMTLKVTLQAEVSTLKEALASENERVREMLGMNCMQLSEFDVTLTAKDEEVARLKGQLAWLYSHGHSCSHTPSTLSALSREEEIVPPVTPTRPWRDTAQTSECFNGGRPQGTF